MSRTVTTREKLPKGWCRVRLEEIASIKTGPFGAQLHQRDYVKSDGTPIVTVEHLSETGLVHENLPLVADHDKNRLSQFLVQEGDILFSRVGSVDRSSLISKKEDGWLFSGRLLRVRPDNKVIDSRYLRYFFQHGKNQTPYEKHSSWRNYALSQHHNSKQRQSQLPGAFCPNKK